MQASLLRSMASYERFAGRKGDSQQKAIGRQDKVSRKLIKQCCTKGTQDHLKRFTDLVLSRLRTDNSPFSGGKVRFPGTKP